MSNDESSKFYEFKAFKEHVKTCLECETKADETFREIMAHAAEQTGRIKQNRIMETP
jgi:hypothetical protein